MEVTGFNVKDRNPQYTTSLLQNGISQPVSKSVQVAKIFSTENLSVKDIYSFEEMDVSALMNIVSRYAPFRVIANHTASSTLNSINAQSISLYAAADKIREHRNRIYHMTEYRLTQTDLEEMAQNAINFLEILTSI